MASARTGDYVVESIGKGGKRGITKVFRSLGAAKNFGKSEVKRGRGIAIDKVTKYGQTLLVQKNMKVTGFKGQFARDFGTL